MFDVQEGRWRFTHDKLRAGVLDGLSEDECPILHRQVAEAIEVTYPGDEAQAVMLMEHWHISGNRDKERECTRIAGQQSLAVSAFRDAISAFERALSLTPENETVGRAALMVAIGNSYEQMSDYSMATQYLEDGLDLAQTSGDRATMVLAYNGLSYAVYHQGNFDRARYYAGKVQELTRETGSQAGVADSLNILGLAAKGLGQYGEARDYFETALGIAREIGDRRRESGCLNNLGTMAVYQGDYIGKQKYFEQAAAIFREIGNRQGEGQAP